MRADIVIPTFALQRSTHRRVDVGYRIAICAGLSAAFTALTLLWSMRFGRQVYYPKFDDIVYFDDALGRLRLLHHAGTTAFLQGLWKCPPHSPFSTALGMVSFALLGANDRSPYIGNGILVFACLAFAAYLARRTKIWQTICILLIVLSVRTLASTVTVFRPDFAIGLLLAMGPLLALERPFVFASRCRQAAIGAVFGLAMLAKPPMFPATLAIFLATLVLASIGDWINAHPPPSITVITNAWLVCLLPFVLLASPYYLRNGWHMWDYFYTNTYGRNRAIWEVRGTIGDRLRYFLVGPGGQVTIRYHIHLFIAIGLAAGAVYLKRGRSREITQYFSVLAILSLALLMCAINPDKHEFMGLIFETPCMFAAIMPLCALATYGNLHCESRRWTSAVLIGITLISIIQFRGPDFVASRTDLVVIDHHRIIDGIYRCLTDHAGSSDAGIYVIGTGDINPYLLRYRARIDGREWHAWDTALCGDMHVATMEIENANFVIAAEPGTGLMSERLRSSQLAGPVIVLLRNRGDFTTIADFVCRATGKHVYVFERVK
jgi:hypothetical protein